MVTPPVSYASAPEGDDPLDERLSRVRWQIEYYFSDVNLLRDPYLRYLMDADGWVPLALLQSVPKVSRENLSLAQVTEALTHSGQLEVSSFVAPGTEPTRQAIDVAHALVRRAKDWAKWPLQGAVFIPPPTQ